MFSDTLLANVLGRPAPPRPHYLEHGAQGLDQRRYGSVLPLPPHLLSYVNAITLTALHSLIL